MGSKPISTSDLPPRLSREARTVSAMVAMYCRDRHGHRGGLCEGCRALGEYADQRLARCAFGADKPTCLNCPIHCYAPEMRYKMRAVMRHSGPRMLLEHPVLAVMHLVDGKRRVGKR